MSAMRDLIAKLIDELVVPAEVGTVKSVDKTNNTCKVVLEGSDMVLPVVRLQSIVATIDAPVVYFPAVDSLVAVSPLFNSKRHWCVTAMSEVEEIKLRGDALGGLVVAEKVAERIERLETALTNLQEKFNTHTHVTSCGSGPGTANPTTPSSTEILTPTTTEEYISNENVKHG